MASNGSLRQRIMSAVAPSPYDASNKCQERAASPLSDTENAKGGEVENLGRRITADTYIVLIPFFPFLLSPPPSSESLFPPQFLRPALDQIIYRRTSNLFPSSQSTYILLYDASFYYYCNALFFPPLTAPSNGSERSRRYEYVHAASGLKGRPNVN